MSKEYPIEGLGLQIKTHWQEHRPQMYRQLEAEGKLDQAVHRAQELTRDLFSDLVSNQGLSAQEAWELVREQHALLPDEEDEPNLPPPASTEPMQEQLFPAECDPAERDPDGGSLG